MNSGYMLMQLSALLCFCAILMLYVFDIYLTFLIAISEDLKAVCCNSQKLNICLIEQGNHLLQPSC